METIRFGLVGYGKVAHLHAQALTEALGATLVSVCGRNDERRDAFAATWHIASRKDVAQMAAMDQVDAVIISTPHPRHHDDALEPSAAGCHVLVEKPMALTEAECNRHDRCGREVRQSNSSVIKPKTLVPSPCASGRRSTAESSASRQSGWRRSSDGAMRITMRAIRGGASGKPREAECASTKLPTNSTSCTGSWVLSPASKPNGTTSTIRISK